MATQSSSPHDCPPADDLDQLIHGRLSDPQASAVTEHVGRCPGCQQRMDALAAGDDSELRECLRHSDRDHPPADSAMWKALSAAEAEVVATALLPGDSTEVRRSGELKLDFLQPAEDSDKLGKLGVFDVLRVIGRGGMGVVLHGHDPCLQRDVAIKVIDPQLADNEVARRRFCREARAAAAVTHENLVAVHQVDEDEHSGLPYLIMQLVQGESLDQRLRRVGKLSVLEVARLGMQTAAGLAAAHAGGLIHRDIKPGNILLEDTTDRVKLTDFGLARAAEDVKLTRTGFVAGSPLYMAPEQARGDEVDARADLFSLGSVLYEAASGTPPFDGKTPLAVLRRVADETQPPLRRVTPDVPQWLSDVIDRLLAKEPADRFQSAAEVAEIFSTELARMTALSPAEASVNGCGKSKPSVYALRRPPVCWKALAMRVLPWVGGAVLGGLIVGLWLLSGSQPASTTPMTNDPPPATTPDVVSVPLVLPVLPAELPRGPRPRIVLDGKAGPVWATAFTRNGQTLVSGAENGTVKLWNPETGDSLQTLEPRRAGNIWAMDMSPDGAYLVVGCDNSSALIYDTKNFMQIAVLSHPNSVKAAAFSPDGKTLVTGDRGGIIRRWHVPEWVPDQDPLEGQEGTVHALAYCPFGALLASGGSDGKIRMWDKDSKPFRQPLVDHNGPVYAVAFSPDKEKARLASAGWDGLVRIWDPQTGQKIYTLRGHDGDVWAVSFGANGKLLASAGTDGTVRVWDVESGKEVQTFRGSGRSFHTVRFAPDGTTLAASSRDGNVYVWDVK